jgi:hypothetical protein
LFFISGLFVLVSAVCPHVCCEPREAVLCCTLPATQF